MSKKVIAKTAKEIAIMRKGGKILHKILHELGKNAVEGATPLEIDKMAHSLCKQYGVRPAFFGYMDFPGAICSSVNNAVVHGIPNSTPLKNGDIFKIDFGVELDGYCTDSAYSFVVGGDETISAEVRKFLDTVQKSLDRAISICKDGVRVGDLGAMIGDTILNAGYSVVEDLGGHGIGKTVHEEPHIFNFGKFGTGMILREGMTIAIEPIANMGKKGIFTGADNWTIFSEDGSLCGHFEHTIVIGKKSGDILTIS